MADTRQFRCDCSRYCKDLKAVSKSTYYAHAQYRDADSKARMQSNRTQVPLPLYSQPSHPISQQSHPELHALNMPNVGLNKSLFFTPQIFMDKSLN